MVSESYSKFVPEPCSKRVVELLRYVWAFTELQRLNLR
jgi:hypothetical protein